MRTPTQILKREMTSCGLPGHQVKLNSYVVTLCKQDGSEVMAVRMEYYQNKTDVHHACLDQYPEWNVKTIGRLYDEDFDL